MASQGGYGNFKLLANSQEEEDAFDYVALRQVTKPTGPLGSVSQLVKGALGAGILGGHAGYMKAGIFVAIPINFICGAYICYCFHTLMKNAQVLYKRTKIHSMSYPDIGEASLACYPNATVNQFAKFFRHLIEFVICMELLGACAAYQVIISKSFKQLVEGTQDTSLEGLPGYPGLRIYLIVMMFPIMSVSLIRDIKYLVPFSLAANVVMVVIIILTMYYAYENNPKFENMMMSTSSYQILNFVGMIIFSMSCAGVVTPIEQHMWNPKKFPYVLTAGMTIITLSVFLTSLCGYAAFLDNCTTPITINFPLTAFPTLLKCLSIIMIAITYAMNFWVPFSLIFVHVKRKLPEESWFRYEMVLRPGLVVVLTIIAFAFPNINALMGFLGAFCLSHMAFLWPFIIEYFVIKVRPGFGRYNWRLVKIIVFIIIGSVVMVTATVVNLYELLTVEEN